MKPYTYTLALIFFLLSCGNSAKKEENGAFAKDKEAAAQFVDFSHIKETGEFIVTTLSGPDTYYDYQGVPLGREYNLMSLFAVSEGLRLRIELAHDTTEMLALLEQGEVDAIAFPLPEDFIKAQRLTKAGATDTKAHTSWAVREESPELAAALEAWWQDGAVLACLQSVPNPSSGQPQVRRHVYAPFLSREKGQISQYDHHFQEAARAIGWDWRLLAAQSYQESAFDPKAISWAGAKGLMQLMPATAASMGVQDVYDPRENILGGARYLRMLNSQFTDITNGEERLRFVLAAYNGGPGHIRDAMALTKKYGKNPTSWTDVSQFVLALQQVKYYRDPVVKNGYMIGSQTYEYVYAVLSRYRTYGGAISAVPSSAAFPSGDAPIGSSPATQGKKKHKIYTPDDPEFNELGE